MIRESRPKGIVLSLTRGTDSDCTSMRVGEVQSLGSSPSAQKKLLVGSPNNLKASSWGYAVSLEPLQHNRIVVGETINNEIPVFVNVRQRYRVLFRHSPVQGGNA